LYVLAVKTASNHSAYSRSVSHRQQGGAVTAFDRPDFEIAIIGATKQVSVAVAP
jgi:hypothetical protein